MELALETPARLQAVPALEPSGDASDSDLLVLVADRDRVFVTYEGHRANGPSFRNTEIVTVRDDQIVEVEVYFGWSIQHEAKPGGFIQDNGG